MSTRINISRILSILNGVTDSCRTVLLVELTAINTSRFHALTYCVCIPDSGPDGHDGLDDAQTG